MKHRHCKLLVDRIMDDAKISYDPITVRDTKILVEEIEDVRAERDDLLRRIGEAIEGWDGLEECYSYGAYERGDPFTQAMESLRNALPFPRKAKAR